MRGGIRGLRRSRSATAIDSSAHHGTGGSPFRASAAWPAGGRPRRWPGPRRHVGPPVMSAATPRPATRRQPVKRRPPTRQQAACFDGRPGCRSGWLARPVRCARSNAGTGGAASGSSRSVPWPGPPRSRPLPSPPTSGTGCGPARCRPWYACVAATVGGRSTTAAMCSCDPGSSPGSAGPAGPSRRGVSVAGPARRIAS